ncbi:site-2 protease family protein [Spirulina major CS-329]|uniref:site-2 protease family protein n=1 Tax=Spirulina TaxID=1154 RepID=UPI00232F6D8F|nr:MULTISPECIES: site-2 protease family protein [Spirulina]MDB9494904.1 site-2 protease family protein [Spirulina subsalsa CS-330]MDB9504131.1 site-2 protease family protein [Spirulina major CS-329]
MNGNIRVGQLFGIPFFINPSWFLILALGTFWFGQEFALSLPQFNGFASLLLGLVTVLLLFASVLAHELGHSLVAMSQGITVKSITLFIFGGLALLEKDAEKPWQSLAIAIAGPLVSIALFILFAGIGSANIGLPLPVLAVLSFLAPINLVLALFNLIPGLPLDGGNILRAIIWKITGNPNKGLLYASRVGQVFGWLAVVIGILAVLGISPIGSLWTTFIGLFLLQNAGMSAQSAQVQDKLDHLTAQDAIAPHSPVAPVSMNVREFVNNYIIGQPQHSQFILTNADGKLLGTLNPESLKTIPTSQWTETSLYTLLNTETLPLTIPAQQSLLTVVKQLEKQPNTTFVVVDEQNSVLGLLEKASIINLLSKDKSDDAPTLPPEQPLASTEAEG